MKNRTRKKSTRPPAAPVGTLLDRQRAEVAHQVAKTIARLRADAARYVAAMSASKKARTPSRETVRLVLEALANVLWVEGNEIQQVRRNRHLVLESFDVESGDCAPYLGAIEVPVEALNNFGELKGEFTWDADELESRVVEQIAESRAWDALPKRDQRAIYNHKANELRATADGRRA